MNNEQIKAKLLAIHGNVEDFTVILTGKSSKRVDGLYHPETREILLHNGNFRDEGALMYTAIHEFAHHMHFTGAERPVSARSHTNRFWDIFHRLLEEAERKGIYRSVFDSDPRFIDLTGRIKENFISRNGMLMKELGAVLTEAHRLCVECGASFDDYVDRVLGIHRNSAKMLLRISSMDISPDIGYENMKTVASIKAPETRAHAEEAFLEGSSPDMVRAEFLSPGRNMDPRERLIREKERLEKSLDRLMKRLAEIDRELEERRER